MKFNYILPFKDISIKNVNLVGGKNASLGEMFSQLSKKGVEVPDGFALTTKAYWYFFKTNDLDKKLKDIFKKFNPKSIKSLQKTGKEARRVILKAVLPEDLKKEIISAYQELSLKHNQKNISVAVRSSGVAEDSPRDSFAGQFESFLNVSGVEKILEAVKKCFASAFGDRIITYRQEKKIPHLEFAVSVGIQRMVRSDLGGSAGVMFTLDTETGFSNVVLVSSVFGVGEEIVKGRLTPDEFYFFKPTKSIIVKNLSPNWNNFSLQDKEVVKLANWAMIIEEHYGQPQDIEWAKDGKTGELFIVQSRPETVHHSLSLKVKIYEEYNLETTKKPILTGISVGNKIGQGNVRVIHNVSKISQFQRGEVLVTRMTDPDWVSIFPLASAIVTEEGGKTSHAAIISRELGLPCIVGVKNATRILKNGQEVTVDCTQGTEGRIFLGKVPFQVKKYDLKKIPDIKTKIMVNIGAPEIAFKTSFLPQDGVGLARQEFIIAKKIKVHPLALYYYKELKKQTLNLRSSEKRIKKIIDQIDKLTVEHQDKKEYFIKELAEGIAQIAAAFWPKPVIIRLSDLKSNEYRALIGGELFEPEEENPMLGWRGAARYYDSKFRPAFEMECKAIKRARDDFGLKNIKLMVPFCRTVEEGIKVLELMKENGLEKGRDGLEVYVMAEIPSNIILANKFLDFFDGMSIGSNDLSQLVLGIDRDSSLVAKIGDERNEAVKTMISQVIKVCKERKKYCGICGQAPSDFPNFADFLVKEGIDSISLNPDTVIKTILYLAKVK